MIRFIRYLRGYVRFTATGVFGERFLNLLHFAGISVWDFTKKEYTLTGYVRAGDYKKLRKHAKKTGVRLHIIEKLGFPFFLRRYKKRIGFAAGVLLFFILLTVMSNFVWTIEVAGNETVSSQRIIGVLDELGIRKGKIVNDSEYYFIEQKALIELPELSWLAINRKGSTIEISVKERTVAPPAVDMNEACDIVSNKDGQIVSIDVFRGTPRVRKGDAVANGDLLVSNVVTDKTSQSVAVHSLARIVADTDNLLKAVVPRRHIEQAPTGREKTKRTFILFGVEIPLYFSGETFTQCEKYVSSSNLSIGDFRLPFGMRREVYKETVSSERMLSDDEMKKRAYEQIQKVIDSEYQGAEIIGRIDNEELTDDAFILQTTLKCREEIGMSVKASGAAPPSIPETSQSE